MFLQRHRTTSRPSPRLFGQTLAWGLTASLSFMGTAAQAQAGFGEPVGAFQLFSFTDLLVTNTAPGGAVAAGGDVSASGCSIGHGLASLGGDVVIAAAGNVVLSNGTFHVGDVVVGGVAMVAQNATLAGGRVVNSDPGIDFAGATAFYTELSGELAALPTTGQTKVESWGGITLLGLTPGLNVFAISEADYERSNGIALPGFDPSLHTVVVNVGGVDVVRSSNGSVFAGQLNAATTFESLANAGDHARHAKLLWNFPQAQTLTSGGSIHGSVLAPKAYLSHSNGRMIGQVIARKISMMNAAELPGGSIFAGQILPEQDGPQAEPGAASPGPSTTEVGIAYD